MPREFDIIIFSAHYLFYDQSEALIGYWSLAKNCFLKNIQAKYDIAHGYSATSYDGTRVKETRSKSIPQTDHKNK